MHRLVNLSGSLYLVWLIFIRLLFGIIPFLAAAALWILCFVEVWSLKVLAVQDISAILAGR